MSLVMQDGSVNIADRTVFAGVSFAAEPGQVTALIGPSGCGKTTLLHCASLVRPLATGQIVYGGELASEWSKDQVRRFWKTQASFVLQEHGIAEEESVLYNVVLPHGVAGWKIRSEDARRAAEVLTTVGLAGRGGDLAVTLSGGEKQRVGVARALFKDARYVFADEPTASLDHANRDHVLALFRAVADGGAMVLCATHDETLIDAADRVIDMTRTSHEPALPGPAT